MQRNHASPLHRILSLALAIGALAGCGAPPPVLTPTTALVTPGATQRFTVKDGEQPLHYALSSNLSGGTVDESGLYVAGQSGGVTDELSVTDHAGRTAKALITVGPSLAVTPGPEVHLHPRATQLFTATGGAGSGYTWSLAANKSGATLSADGHYVAGVTGGVTDQVQLADALGNKTLVSVKVIGSLSVTPLYSSVTGGASVSFAVTGGSGALTWTVSAPESGGTVDGTGAYVAGASTGSDVVRVTDADGNVGVATVRVTAPPVGGYTPATHHEVLLSDQGGGALHHPVLVSIVWGSDPNKALIQKMGDYLMHSDWLAQVGGEYGATSGEHAYVELPDKAPRTIDDSDIQSDIAGWIDDKTVPGLDDAEYVYMVYIPTSTTETSMGQGLCDFSGGGYHSEGTRNDGGSFTYGIASPCNQPPLSPTQTLEVAAAHELIEAITDPLPNSAPGYALSRSGFEVWSLFGGEVGDLCSYAPMRKVGGFQVPTVYSSAAAATGGTPCVPGNDPDFTVTATPTKVQSVAAGQSVTLQLAAWSSIPMGSWTLHADTGPTGFGRPFTPTLSLSQSTVKNGDVATLTITVPAGTPSQSSALIYLSSYTDQNNVNYELAGVFVP